MRISTASFSKSPPPYEVYDRMKLLSTDLQRPNIICHPIAVFSNFLRIFNAVENNFLITSDIIKLTPIKSLL